MVATAGLGAEYAKSSNHTCKPVAGFAASVGPKVTVAALPGANAVTVIGVQIPPGNEMFVLLLEMNAKL
jgi:hypothetical protein